MKIIFEPGDTVELHDDIDVPLGLGASTICLEHEFEDGKWSASVVESFSETKDVGDKITMDPMWFLTP